MSTALIQGRIATDHTDRLREILDSSWKVLEWDPREHPVDAFEPLAVEADVVIGGKIPLAHWPAVPKLKLFEPAFPSYTMISDGLNADSSIIIKWIMAIGGTINGTSDG